MNKKNMLIVLALILGLALLFGGGESVTAQTEAAQAVPVDQIIVKYKDDTHLNQADQAQAHAQMQRLTDTAGAALTYFRVMSGDAHVLRLEAPVSADEAVAMTSRLAALPEVEYAEPDYKMFAIESPASPLQIPDDPMYAQQWHYGAPTAGSYGVNAPAAWDITTGAGNVYVAVLDTGITDHADLAGRWQGGYDMISDAGTGNDGDGRDADPRDPGDWCGSDPSSWHGTHVAGTIGAASNNTTGVAGLNWVSKIIPVRVLGKCGGYSSDIADGIRWAAGLSVAGVPANAYPVQVQNLSLGGNTPSPCGSTFQNAITDAYNAGSTIVISAGNNGDNSDEASYSPGNCNNVITVASTDRDGDRAYYSNYGPIVEISAPGGETYNASDGVLSTLNTGTQGPVADTYAFYQGTSMAAPHIAGVASLMYSLNPSLTPAQVVSIMQSTVTAFPAGSSCNTGICGPGIVNAASALVAVPGAIPGTPNISPISNPDGDGNFTVDWNDVANATSYTLQEDDNAAFSSPTTAYTGAASQAAISGKTGGTWYYRVRSSNSAGNSAWSTSAAAMVIPNAPVLNAISNPSNADAYTISWVAAVGADAYKLEESTSNTFASAVTRYDGAATQYEITGQAGGDWYYRVLARNAGGESGWSNVEMITVTLSVLSAPDVQPISNAAGAGDFTVQWDTVSGATGYILEESHNPYFVNPVEVYSGAATQMALTGRAGGTWYYRARATDSTEQSPWGDSESTYVNTAVYLPLVSKNHETAPPPPTCVASPAGDANNVADSLRIYSGQAVTGEVSSTDLDDVFRLYVVDGQQLTIALSGPGDGDADLYLYAPDATDVNSDEAVAWSQNIGNGELIQGTALVTGDWFIDVYSYSGTTCYNLTATISSAAGSETIEFTQNGVEYKSRDFK